MPGISDIVINLTILLGAALIGGMIAHRLKQPLILGYLVVGVVIGPHALGLVKEIDLVSAMATIGVALLMLTLGLEVSFAQLRQVGRVGIWGGTAQILLTLGFGILVASLLFGWSLTQSVLFGLIISMSSTMVGLKILMDRGELDSMHGRVMLALLIFQDIAAVLMIVIQPLLSGVPPDIFDLVRTIGAALIFIAIAIVSGIWLLPWLMGNIGGVRSRELFLLTVLVLSLGGALGTQILGLSAVFGAFLIGLVLRETRFAHQALAEITPLRDIFAALFFVSLGMLLNPRFVAENWWLIIIAVVLIIAIKFLTIFGIVRFFGYGIGIALLSAAGLIQIGEFSFVLAQGGVSTGILSEEAYSLVIGVSIITMLFTPLSMTIASRLFTRFTTAKEPKYIDQEIPFPLKKPAEIVIAGFGRVGQTIARGLEDAGILYSVVELDPEVIFKLRCRGVACIYGDASNIHVLSKIDLEKTRILVVTFPDLLASLTTIRTALAINPKLRIVARAHREKDAEELRRLGVHELVSPEYEASLKFLHRVLTECGWESNDIQRTLAKVRWDAKFSEGPDEGTSP